MIKAIPSETDAAKLKQDYTELVKIYLTDVPSFTLMYRPQSFHTVNESVWTNFPHQDDGTKPRGKLSALGRASVHRGQAFGGSPVEDSESRRPWG